MLLSEAEHERVRAAVDAAETRTCGEIVCVLARECSEYWEVPLAWAIGFALIVPAVAFLLGLRPEAIAALAPAWTSAQAADVEPTVGRALATYAVVQGVLFVIVACLASVPAVRRVLTPGPLKRERVHRRAAEQFSARAYHLTPGQTGVLIFASLAEHQAVVLADSGVASRVGTGEWTRVVNALVKGMGAKDPAGGFVNAIGEAADILAEHCPPVPGDVNHLPDSVIELEY
jgi:putative membrane protein